MSVDSSIIRTQDVQVHSDRIEYGLYYFPDGSGPGERHPVVIDADQFFENVRFPAHMIPGGQVTVGLTDKIAIQIDHWVNLWAANLAAILIEGARVKKSSPARLLWLATRAGSLNQYRVLRRLNRVGRNCDIHPTAYIEGSTVGDNVKIGAGAIVRASIIGDDCSIANNATLELSVVGAGSTIFNGCVVQYSVLYPGACISCRYVGLNLAGRDTFISDGVTLSDFRFDGRNVQVLKDGKGIDSGARLLGTCLGHGVYLGAGCVLSPGRAVPNGWRIVPESRRVLEAFPAGGHIEGHRVLRANEIQPEVEGVLTDRDTNQSRA
ncbi:MAG: hypothetical protein A2133_05230 [Actinobacteria bacterium RBG_16_64_13]|nr:MAG: hypothetical protein A2133_05230 [Actinobacteria bacterium RBG_16_64_13]